MLRLLIFWASYAYFPAAVICIWLLRRGQSRALQLTLALFLAGTSVLAYARFVEPRLLNVERAEIDLSGGAAETQDIRIALIGDTHYGIFGNTMAMDRIVARVKAEGADALFIAGDMTYHPREGQIEAALASLSALDIPIVAVLGNHDVGFPGPDLTDPVMKAFSSLGVVTVENRALDMEIGGAPVTVAGASDLWQRAYDFGFSANLPENRPVLLLTHNPDTAAVVPDTFDYDMMLAGHTHGGQIRLPFLYKRAIPTQWPFDKGLHIYPSGGGNRLVYVTPGTGMVGLPMRFLMPPQVDMITLRVPAPRDTPSPSSPRSPDTSGTP